MIAGLADNPVSGLIQNAAQRLVASHDAAFAIHQCKAVADGFECGVPFSYREPQGFFGLAGAQQSTDCSQQDLWLDGLRQVAVGAAVQTANAISVIQSGS